MHTNYHVLCSSDVIDMVPLLYYYLKLGGWRL